MNRRDLSPNLVWALEILHRHGYRFSGTRWCYGVKQLLLTREGVTEHYQAETVLDMARRRAEKAGR